MSEILVLIHLCVLYFQGQHTIFNQSAVNALQFLTLYSIFIFYLPKFAFMHFFFEGGRGGEVAGGEGVGMSAF